MAGSIALRGNCNALLLIVALAFISHAHGGTGFRFNYFNLTKKIGETFETECVMDNFRRYQDAVNIKKMVFESGNPHVVGTNGMINSEFQNGRFSASFDLSPSNTAIFKLTINPVKGEDEGTYFCGVESVKKYLTVEKEITSVKMTHVLSSASGSNNTANAASVTTTESQNWKLRLGQDPQITCVVTIASLVTRDTPTDLKVTVTSGDRDITSQFQSNQVFVVSGEKTGLQSFKFELTKKSTPATDGATGFLPTEDDNEKELACTASLKSGSKSDKVLLTVQYPPKLECENGYAEEKAEGRVTCKVHGNPLPQDIEWTVGDKVLRNGDSSDDYKVEQRTDGKFGFETTLIVSAAKATHFAETFSVKAVNNLGTVTSDPVYLKKAEKPSTTPKPEPRGGESTQATLSTPAPGPSYELETKTSTKAPGTAPPPGQSRSHASFVTSSLATVAMVTMSLLLLH